MIMWHKWIADALKQIDYEALENYINQQSLKYTIYPPKTDWFKAFELTPVEDLKVVILGQDPYHGPNQAHGLSFSTKDKKLPPSLKNIYKELVDDLNITMPTSGDLTPWAKQGVLLLNTILTVEAGRPSSHKNIGWEKFVEHMLKHINELNQPIVYILWGNYARSYKHLLTNSMHLVLESSHPSPFSARNGFFGSKPFSKTNAFLVAHKVKPIDWQIK